MDIKRLIADIGGKVDDVVVLPDGSGFATASFPLPQNHWSIQPGLNVPPMSFRMIECPQRREMAEKVRAAIRYAYRAATMNGKETDLDPDALVQNAIVGLLGYHTADGLSSDAWANPSPVPSTHGWHEHDPTSRNDNV